MIKAIINNEEVVSNKDLTISEELLKTSSTILNNCYPKSWETAHDYISNFYFPKDYSKCCLYNETIITPITGQTVNGTNFTIDYDDTLNSRLEKIEGDTFQNSYTGKNLLNPSTLTTGTINGITCSYDNTTKIITFNGKCTKDNTIFDFSSTTILFQANKTKQIIYYESGTLTNYGQFRSFSSSYGAGIIMDMTQLSSSNNKMMRSNTFDVEKTRFSFRFDNGSVANNFKVKVMITNDDNTDFEPYVGKTASPNPDYPQAINNVTGEQVVEIAGKNLYDPSYRRQNGTIFVNNGTGTEENGVFTLTATGSDLYIWDVVATGLKYSESRGQLYELKEDSYTVSISNPLFTKNYITYYDKNGVSLGYVLTGQSTFNVLKSAKSGAKYFTLRIGYGQAVSDTSYSFTVQLEKGIVTTPVYEPYIGHTYKLNLGKNLFNKDNFDVLQAHLSNTTTISNTSPSNRTLYIKIKPNTTYTIQKVLSTCFIVGTTEALPDVRQPYYRRQIGFTNVTLTTGSKSQYLLLWYYNTADTLTEQEILNTIQIEENPYATSYSPYFTPIELCKIGTYQDYIYRDNGNWYLHKEISKVVLDGSENWQYYNRLQYITSIDDYKTSGLICLCSHYIAQNNVIGTGDMLDKHIAFRAENNNPNLYIKDTNFNDNVAFKSWLSNNNVIVYYILATPTNTLITNETLIEQLNSVALINGINNVNVISPNLSGSIQIYYNYRIGETIDDLIFCGLVKNTGNISLNPREPHYCDLQVLDFKTMLSEGQTLDFVISNQTIGQAIERVIEEISSYGFVLGEIDIDAENDVIGAYSTLNKTPYDVFQYLADISQSKWFTRVIDENTIAIDFYDSDKLPVADNIEYTQEYFKQNNIVDISFSFNSNDYRNKQIILSQQVYGNVDVIDDVISNGYNTSFTTTQIIGNVTNITVDGVAKTFTTNAEKNIGLTADFYYTPNSDKFESDSPYTAGSQITIEYTPLIKGRRIVNNNVEINRINEQIDRNGTISRYEERNDILDGDELTKVAETYIKYKGEKEITLNITTLNNDLFNIGEQVYFDMPYVNDLSTTYLVKKKDIQITQIGESGNVFYEYSLSSNFNSESDINYFDNQRRKAEGNITEDNFITRNIDIQDSANIIFDNLNIVEITMTGDNVLNSPLNSPFNN